MVRGRAREPRCYVHVLRTHAVIYHPRTAEGEPPTTVPLQGWAADRAGVLREALDRLSALGWQLAQEGWREPLDPGTGLLATAALMPAVRLKRASPPVPTTVTAAPHEAGGRRRRPAAR